MNNKVNTENAIIEPLSDEAFLTQFESLCLDPVYFNHVGHLRLAWLYLQQYKLTEAIAKTSQGISRYATSLGAADKYHATITEALLHIMAKRMEQAKQKDWSLFLQQNKDLEENALALLAKHYSEELLASDVAKKQLVAPDLVPF